jgi:hypothetical protein
VTPWPAQAREVVHDTSVLFKVVGEGDDALHTNDDNGERDAGNSDILAMG